MPRANRLALYADVKQVLDEALVSNGGQYVLPSHGEAVHWRQRVYKFRKAYAEVHGSSPYDILTFPRLESNSRIVAIEVRRPAGIFRPTQPTQATSYDSEAEALASKLLRGDAI